MTGKARRRQRIRKTVAARRASYALFARTTLDLWDACPLTYRQWCHPRMRRNIQAAMDGAHI